MNTFLLNFSYPGIVLVLLLSGLGVPVPEDVPLLIGGYLCAPNEDGLAFAQLYLMIPMTFLAVLTGDSMLYFLGRKYGHHVPRLPLLRLFLDRAHLARAEKAFQNHGGKTLFIGRFLPGLRAPIFFTAGAFNLPFWKVLTFDGTAALISVPTLVLLGWYFADHIDRVKELTFGVQILLVTGVVAAVVSYFLIKRIIRHRRAGNAVDSSDASLRMEHTAMAIRPPTKFSTTSSNVAPSAPMQERANAVTRR